MGFGSMKYMGSKRTMLSNGLGDVLRAEVGKAKRFVDMFSGSSAVAWYVAEKFPCSVIAADLQAFAACLAGSVIGRDVALNPEIIWKRWSKEAEARACESNVSREAERFDKISWGRARRRNVNDARGICQESQHPITKAYGGHYFSPKQAMLIDALRMTLPEDPLQRSAALAALICAASECAAAPGHTAQPFQPTKGAAPFLFDAWRRDVLAHTKSALEDICPRHAQIPGQAVVSDAVKFAESLSEDDLAFVDPPYSGVHYSRFYHVLETIARGTCDDITGIGRYPDPSERPKSDFSIQSKSKAALDNLLSILAERKVRTIVTFPRDKASNGLSGRKVQTVAERYFRATKTVVNGRFSTLGGILPHRKARIPAYEMILQLQPLKRHPTASNCHSS
jgi:adenine-specific DNA-methyltransferase